MFKYALSLEESSMASPINADRIKKALQAVRQAEMELEAALSESERPRPDPMPGPVRLIKHRKSMRRLTDNQRT
jgi:hypothetical protein